MKALHKIQNLPFLIFGVGLAGILLRVTLYTVGADHRGLISSYHPLHILCLLLTAATGVHIALCVQKSKISANIFPAGKNGILLPILACLCFLAYAFITMDQISDRFDAIRTGMAFAVVPCFLLTGYFQYKQIMPHFGFHCIITIFFGIDIVCRYRIWSGNPQLADYFFQLLACIFLMLSAYYCTAFDAGLGSRRKWLFCSLMTILFCMLSFVGGDQIAFYAGGILWAISGICLPEPVDKADETEET